MKAPSAQIGATFRSSTGYWSVAMRIIDMMTAVWRMTMVFIEWVRGC